MQVSCGFPCIISGFEAVPMISIKLFSRFGVSMSSTLVDLVINDLINYNYFLGIVFFLSF